MIQKENGWQVKHENVFENSQPKLRFTYCWKIKMWIVMTTNSIICNL